MVGAYRDVDRGLEDPAPLHCTRAFDRKTRELASLVDGRDAPHVADVVALTRFELRDAATPSKSTRVGAKRVDPRITQPRRRRRYFAAEPRRNRFEVRWETCRA